MPYFALLHQKYMIIGEIIFALENLQKKELRSIKKAAKHVWILYWIVRLSCKNLILTSINILMNRINASLTSYRQGCVYYIYSTGLSPFSPLVFLAFNIPFSLSITAFTWSINVAYSASPFIIASAFTVSTNER